VPADGPDLQSAVALANQRVYETGQSHPESPRGSMGTTVVVLFCALSQRQAYWAHVGDSRLYRVRKGELTLLTADHTLFGEPFLEQTSVPFDLPHTNRLIRAIGIEPTVDVTFGSMSCAPAISICCAPMAYPAWSRRPTCASSCSSRRRSRIPASR
jgi:protein phosphatase